MTLPYQLAPLGPGQDRAAFDCLEPALTAYLLEGRVDRDVQTGQAAAFVLLEGAAVVGYFTLASASVSRKDFSAKLSRAFGYPLVSVTLLGRLAVHRELRGQGVGRALIVRALGKALEASLTVGSFAVVVDAKNGRVAELYEELGFTAFRDEPLKLFLPMATVRGLLGM